MSYKRDIGETGYLKEPYLGYRHYEIVGHEQATGRVIIELSSGKQITVHEDELE